MHGAAYIGERDRAAGISRATTEASAPPDLGEILRSYDRQIADADVAAVVDARTVQQRGGATQDVIDNRRRRVGVLEAVMVAASALAASLRATGAAQAAFRATLRAKAAADRAAAVREQITKAGGTCPCRRPAVPPRTRTQTPGARLMAARLLGG